VPYCVFDTAIGCCGLAWNGRGITHMQLPDRDRDGTERQLRRRVPGEGAAEPPAEIAPAIGALQRYFAGEAIDLSSITVDLGDRGSADLAIYAALRAVGWGETVTYGELARRAGLLHGAQAVGQAMAKNPVPVIVPCHRVLAAGGRIGGFSAPGGTSTKERLLGLEGVRLDTGAPRLPGL
jgi:methylated-DNA-[protein]-cysteine S-methyltransferase